MATGSEITADSLVCETVRIGDWIALPPLRRLKWWQLWKRWREWRRPKTFRVTGVSSNTITLDGHE
jgi:hypothetical protein